jgi:hypothetical protein
MIEMTEKQGIIAARISKESHPQDQVSPMRHEQGRERTEPAGD